MALIELSTAKCCIIPRDDYSYVELPIPNGNKNLRQTVTDRTVKATEDGWQLAEILEDGGKGNMHHNVNKIPEPKCKRSCVSHGVKSVTCEAH